jgi:NAD-dependent oxidoreductase involved in siderophore biosynthesis
MTNRKEEIPAAALQPLLSELAGRGVYTAHQLQSLTRTQWREIMHAAGMPVSLARSAMKLASPPPPTEFVIIDE